MTLTSHVAAVAATGTKKHEQGAVAVASYDELYRVNAAPVRAALLASSFLQNDSATSKKEVKGGSF